MCTVLLPPGGYPTAVKYIISIVKNTDLLNCIFWQRLTDICTLYDEHGGIPHLSETSLNLRHAI